MGRLVLNRKFWRLFIFTTVSDPCLILRTTIDSTMLPGLVRVMKRIAESSSSIDTIVPGRIYQATKSRQSATTGSVLQLKLTTASTASTQSQSQSYSQPPSSSDFNPIANSTGISSQKIIARTNSQAQEVFLSLKHGSFRTTNEVKIHLESLLLKEKGVEVVLQQRFDNGSVPSKTKSLMEIAIQRNINWR